MATGSHLPPLVSTLTASVSRLKSVAGNAVKFTDRGTISLRASLMEEDCKQLLIRFEAPDTGLGIAPEKLPLLFQAFE